MRATRLLRFQVAIVGRPNVGKSTLFNALRDVRSARERPAPGAASPTGKKSRQHRLPPAAQLTSPVARTTRDRGAFPGMPAVLRDLTAGCVANADVALVVLDGAAGVTGDDHDVARWLRSAAGDVPRLVLFNKMENDRQVAAADLAFAETLARAAPLSVSAEHGDGLPDVLDALRAFAAAAPSTEEDELLPSLDDEVRVALVGRPNVGKSTLVNALARSNVAVAAPEPGVTRDAVECAVDVAGRAVRLVDTAGVRRVLEGTTSRASKDAVEERAARSTELEVGGRCDVAVFVVDCSGPLRRDDLRLARHLSEARLPVVVLANKVDAYRAGGAAHDANVAKRISTGALNTWFRDFRRGPRGEAFAAVRYLAQVGHAPPTFALFGRNLGAKLKPKIRETLAAAIGADFGFRGARVALILRGGGAGALGAKARKRAGGTAAAPEEPGRRRRAARRGRGR
ncbi:GTP binding protein [Aureococcus anophagefferens]|nr:GTP binding protein [Aureococcus anophagefferens]